LNPLKARELTYIYGKSSSIRDNVAANGENTMTKSDISRRGIIGSIIAAVTSIGFVKAADSKPVTPPHTEGPFYPIVPQDEKDADLTMVNGRPAGAIGQIVIVEGQILDPTGAPIPNAVVDVWQANAAGRYAHEADPNTAPLDPNFQGWAIMKTDKEGRYRFKTVKPGAYPVTSDWTRPPHIHFKVSRRGFREITTQMYFDGERLNDIDHLLNELPADMQPTLIAQQKTAEAPFVFDVILAKI